MGNSQTIEALKSIFPGSRSALERPRIEVIPTHWPSLNDIVLGCGGLPRGRSIEVYAKPSIGKTTLVLNLIASIQQSIDGLCSFFDAEGSLQEAEFTDAIGVDRGKLFLPEFTDGDNCLFQAKQQMALNMFDLICIDSLKALKPRTTVEIEDDNPDSMHDNFARAKMLSVFFQDIRGGFTIKTSPTKKGEKPEIIPADKTYFVDGSWTSNYHKLQDKKSVLIMINHEMDKQGVTWGSKVSTSGGDSKNFDASIRLRIQTVKTAKKKDKFGTPEFRIISITADKNKVAPPKRSAEFFMQKTGSLEELSEAGSKYDIEAVDSVDSSYDDSLSGSDGLSFKKHKK